MTKKEIKFRLDFLTVYQDFTEWLYSVGFRPKDINEGSSAEDNWCSAYESYVDSLFGTEVYIHDALKLVLRFARDRNEHKCIFIGMFGCNSDTYPLQDFKNEVMRWLSAEKAAKLEHLNSLTYIP